METYGKKYPVSSFPDGQVVDDRLREEFKAAGVVAPFVSSYTESGGTEISLWFSQPLTAQDSASMNLVVATHRASLALAKQHKYAAIDAKTDAMIARGFAHKGVVLSLSLEAQMTMTGLYTMREDPAVSYPVQFNALDDTTYVNLVDAADVRVMALTAMATLRSIIDSGSMYKNAVRNCATVAEVGAVVDTRE